MCAQKELLIGLAPILKWGAGIAGVSPAQTRFSNILAQLLLVARDLAPIAYRRHSSMRSTAGSLAWPSGIMRTPASAQQWASGRLLWRQCLKQSTPATNTDCGSCLHRFISRTCEISAATTGTTVTASRASTLRIPVSARWAVPWASSGVAFPLVHRRSARSSVAFAERRHPSDWPA